MEVKQANQAKGKTLLLVSGVLLILWNLISVVSGLIGIIGGLAGSMTIGIVGNASVGATFGGLITIIIFCAIAMQLFYFFCGIIGVLNSGNPKKAGKCYVLGIIMLVFAVIGLIVAFAEGGATFLSMLASLVSLVLPILYVMGASKNKSNA